MDLYTQQTLELVLKASNEGIWDWDIANNEIYYSDRIYRFFGHDKDCAPNIMTHPEKLLHKDDVPYFQNVLTLTLMDSDEDFLGIDCRIIRPDGSMRWLRIRGSVIWENDQAQRITGSIIDISKRKFAEDMIQEERNMLRLIIDNIPLQVYFKDTESHYVLVNQRQADWLGVSSPNEVHGRCGADFFTAEAWESIRAEEIRIMQTGEPVIDAVQKEMWQNKSATYVKKNKYPWYDSTGKLLGCFGIACDVTKLVEAQQKLAQMAMSLKNVNGEYEEELQLAREIQHALLPENSDDWNDKIALWSNKLDIKHLYIPATELAGDYYDVISIDENKIGFLIIDVMGHGASSALIVSLIRGLLEKGLPSASQPAQYLQQLNYGLSSLLSRASVTLFATACYVVFDFEKNQLSVSCAGHDRPLISFSKLPDELPECPKNPALGFFADAEYKQVEFPLESIRKVLLYTDGIYESANAEEQEWGIDSLIDEFQQHSNDDLETTQKSIAEKALTWSGAKGFDDDVCLLGAEIITPASPPTLPTSR